MSSLVLYGSNAANATLTNACNMASTTGGTETSNRTSPSGSTNIAEVFSLGGTSTSVSSIPATPTGHGWTYSPGAGTFATGNWSAACGTRDPFNAYTISSTIRFFRYSGGTYTSIGTINIASFSLTNARTVATYAATSMSTITFASGDLLYTDLWYDTTPGSFGNVNGAKWDIYESTSASTGVANDMQITTSNFTASGGATHLRIYDGYGGVVS